MKIPQNNKHIKLLNIYLQREKNQNSCRNKLLTNFSCMEVLGTYELEFAPWFALTNGGGGACVIPE